jgi:hypothetical protein
MKQLHRNPNLGFYESERCISEIMASYEDLTDNDFYVYESLHGQPHDTIRLLTLQPGTKTDRIVCTLTPTQLSRATNYTALSYVWGSACGNPLIVLNVGLLRIRPSLLEFLSHIRHKKLPIVLWTDAICVNQQDLKESGHQVKLMADIYRAAQIVFLRLGEDTHGVEKIFFRGLEPTQSLPAQSLSVANSATPKLDTKLPGFLRELEMETSDLQTNEQLLAKYPYLKLNHRSSRASFISEDRKAAKYAFNNLCHRMYWRRM